MADNGHDPVPLPPPPAPPPTQSGRRVWVILVVLVLLVGGAALAARYAFPKKPEPQATPLDGKLMVVVRAPEQRVDALPIEQTGALPVRPGGIMSLEVEYNQPAYTYLLWIDSAGRVTPLYPWNPESLEVRDADAPAPVRKPTNRLYSPPIGGGWKFGDRAGVETVLLLARRTPLEEGTKLGSLVGPLPPPRLRQRDELALFGLNRGAESVSTLLAQGRGVDAEARAADEPLHAMMLRLRDHFELIRALRFAHVEEEKKK